MKKGLIALIMIIVCFSCGTNVKPVSDAQKEKIIGEVKEVLKTIIKGAQEANSDMAMGTMLNSPDFVFTMNGQSFNYQQCADMGKTVFASLINQEGTLSNEKFAVLDHSTVLFTADSKWIINLKDGSCVLQEPWGMQYLFKKVNNEWKVLSANESGMEKFVPGEAVKGLNQVELMGQLKGVWQSNFGKDTVEIWDCQPYGKSSMANVHQIIKGQKVPLYMNNASFDSKDGTFKGFTLWYNGNYGTWIGLFNNEKTLTGNFVWDFHSSKSWGKFQIEFVSSKEFTWKFFNKDGVKTGETIYKKVK
jgi:hypothetical protein